MTIHVFDVFDHLNYNLWTQDVNEFIVLLEEVLDDPNQRRPVLLRLELFRTSLEEILQYTQSLCRFFAVDCDPE